MKCNFKCTFRCIFYLCTPCNSSYLQGATGAEGEMGRKGVPGPSYPGEEVRTFKYYLLSHSTYEGCNDIVTVSKGVKTAFELTNLSKNNQSAQSICHSFCNTS